MRLGSVCMVFMLVVVSGMSANESFQALFDKANHHFESGDFQSARDLYVSIIQQGCISDKVFYNLGNCYLKLGDIGRAILSYKRAQRIAPRDPDVSANLELARTLVPERVQPIEPGLFLKVIRNIHQNLTLTETTWGAAVFYLLTISLAVASRLAVTKRYRRQLVKASLISLLFLLLISSILGGNIYNIEIRQSAVAVESEVISRSGPGDHFAEVYKQQSGYEMVVLRKQSGWAEVILENGYTGWIPERTIEFI